MKLVVLTKSAKRMHNGTYGKCVAGINENGKWVRLVSCEDGDSLSNEACKAFGCLDVIKKFGVSNERYCFINDENRRCL